MNERLHHYMKIFAAQEARVKTYRVHLGYAKPFVVRASGPDRAIAKAIEAAKRRVA